MSRSIIDIHILQTVPPSNLNRDDTGSPKTAVYGGERRSRVSSQAWKRATRESFKPALDPSEYGMRTKRVVEVLGERIAALSPDLAEKSNDYAKQAINMAGIKTKLQDKKDTLEEAGYLVFLSEVQLNALAEAAVRAAAEDDFGAAIKAMNLKSIANHAHSVDIALFGRMVADLPELNVDAAAQVAHAISVHAVQTEYDYFTAVDDRKAADDDEDAGAAMIGTVEFNSATLYRYATVDVDRLSDNLGNAAATERAVQAFIRAFVTSMPTGKQNTFANRTLPDAVLVTLGGSQSVNLVGAFEDALPNTGSSSRVGTAARRLAEHAGQVHAAYGTSPDRSWVVAIGAAADALDGVGPTIPLDQLVDELGSEVGRRLAESA